MTRRAITCQQPHATLLVAGIKTVENRTWAAPPLPWTACPCVDRGAVYATTGPDLDGSPEPCDHCDDTGQLPPRLWVHAGKTVDVFAVHDHLPAVREALDLPGATPLAAAVDALPTGALLGSVALVDCHHASDPIPEAAAVAGWCHPWGQPDAYHWLVADAQPLARPEPMRGRLGLWTLPDDEGAP